jgi:hypothetical protein
MLHTIREINLLALMKYEWPYKVMVYTDEQVDGQLIIARGRRRKRWGRGPE